MAMIVHERYAAYSSCFRHLLHNPLLWTHPIHFTGSMGGIKISGFHTEFLVGEGKLGGPAPLPRPDPSEVMYAYVNEIIDVFKEKNHRINL